MTFSQILDLIKRMTNGQNATSSSYPLAAQVVDVNNALNNFFLLANRAAGNWRPADDTNQEDYPTIYTDLVSGQDDYSFITDENGNQILDIYKIRLLNPDGITWITLDQIDQDGLDDSYINPITTGVPSAYYLTANGINFNIPPNYDMKKDVQGVSGIQVQVNRTPTYFTISDITKVAGIPWIFMEYLALRPSYFYCMQKGLPQAGGRLKNGAYTGYLGNLKDMETDIGKYYRDRNKDFRTVITSETIDSR